MTEDMEHSFCLEWNIFEHYSALYRSDGDLSGMEHAPHLRRDHAGYKWREPCARNHPAGEGAGYAEALCSAAMDGLRLADDVMKRYHPVY